jgi:amino acid adenylation domain-containing protein
VDIARWRAECQPQDPAFTFLTDGQEQQEQFTYAGLDRAARRIAAELQARGAVGQRVLLVFDPGLQYIAAVLGCLYAGAVAVPVYPPDPFRAARTLPRLQAILKDAQAKLILSSRAILDWARGPLDNLCGVETLAVEDIPAESHHDWRPPAADPRRLALLQYTSGSTGTPRGVMLSHANLLYHCRAAHQRIDVEGAVAVGWVPPYHDMGLIGCILLPLHSGRLAVLMSPLAFIQRPSRWLSAISRWRATTSAAPNFGYDLCVRKVSPEECAGLDLSCWRIAINGAEPIRAETMDRFAAAFAPYGFRREAFYPAYGMAEATLLVTGGLPGQLPHTPTFCGRALAEDCVEESPPQTDHARRLVGCGQPLPGSQVAIVDPATGDPMPPGRVGEIWFRGPAVGLGYWNRPEETERIFHARLADHPRANYLRTGDLGFVHNNQVFVTGRLKELIIVNGHNYYPQDIESAVARCHPALKPDGGAAFSVDVAGQEQLVVVHEVSRPKRHDLAEVLRAVRAELLAECELNPHAVVLISSGTLPKTSSGKTRRGACRDAFVRSEFSPLAQWQAGANGHFDAVQPAPAALAATPLEETLVRFWCEVLGREAVGRNDDFFDLGGNSLLAGQLAGRVSAECGVEVPLRVLFAHPTAAALAGWIESLPVDPVARSRWLPVVPRQPDEPAVLSSAEQRLWFFDQLQPHHPFYNMPVAARLHGPLADQALDRSVQELVRRHESLRTVFPANFGRSVRRVVPAGNQSVRRVDLRGIAAAEREQELQRQVRAEAREPFDLAQGPLLRCVLYRLADEHHVLLLVMHHIIVDGWSVGIMAREFGLLYAAFAEGRPSPLAPLELQYADYAVWQQKRTDGELCQRELTYWKQQLADAPLVLDLPLDRPRPAQQSFEGAWHPLELPAELSAGLRELARRQRTTLFAVLLAAYKVLLARYCRQDDIAVGTVVANRTRQQLEPLVGFFANTLVLRTDLSGDPSFRELLARVNNVTSDAYAHQDLPFEKLVEALCPDRRANRSPLFQAALVLENMPLELPNVRHLRAEPLPIDNGTAKYDLAFLISETAGGLSGNIEYATALFDPQTIAHLGRAWLTLLQSAVDAPDRPISRLPLVDGIERRRVAAGADPAAGNHSAAETLHGLFETHARRSPDRVALCCGVRQFTYGELDRRASAVARYLRSQGLQSEQPVTVCLDRSAELVIALLGVLKAGGVYVPLDPYQPIERLAYLVEDAQAPLVLTQQRWVERLPQTNAKVLLLDQIALGDDDFSPVPAPWRVEPQQLAYIIYTSGSTGRPKGAMIEHRGVVNFLRGFSRELQIEADSRVLHFFSPSSDGSISDIFSALANGACLVVAEHAPLAELDHLAALIRTEHVTVATLTPSMLAALPAEELPALQTVCSVGETLAPQLAARWSAGRRLMNGYGLTETSIGACLGLLDGAASHHSVIGQPLEGVQVYILDEHLEPLPAGAPGEICIGGVQVGRGYWNRPELTAARFVADPCGEAPQRLYRTGDLGRQRADGQIEYLGRLDEQIKVRGYRVEPGEIVLALQQHSRVEQAAVVLREDRPGEPRLVAYVVPSANGTADRTSPQWVPALLSHLRSRLPAHMVPAAIVLLDDLPRLVQGKLDRRALPPPPSIRPDVAQAFVAPRSEFEKLVAHVWEELLGIRPIGVADNFFDLGGHSLLAVQMLAEIQRRTQRRLPLAALFQQATVEHVAQLLAQPERNAADSALVPLRREGSGRPFFCIHPAGGTVFCYRLLAEYLGAERPVYGLQALGVDGTCEPHSRVDAMVAHYLTAIRSVQPHGPYLLGGWSLGGNLAFEAARQLAEQGEEIGLLALFDAGALAGEGEPSEADFLPMMMALFADEENLPLEQIHAMAPAEQLQYFLHRAAQADIAPTDPAAGRHVFEVFKASMQAILDYRQKPYSGKLTLFAAEHREAWFGSDRDPHLGWDAWARGGVEVHGVPGGHIQMVLEPHVRTLAEKLRRCLRAADPHGLATGLETYEPPG